METELCKCGKPPLRGKDACLACLMSFPATDIIKKIRGHEEDSIQEAFFNAARVMFPAIGKRLYHACNEGKRNPQRSKKIGIVSGVADVHLAIPNKFYASLYIEFKAGTNKQTPEQKEFQKQVEEAGNKYVVCYSAEEAIGILKYYLITSKYK